MLEIVQGDLFDADTDAIAHGCNCQGLMGSGIAVQFRKRYPDMYYAYRTKCQEGMFGVGSVMEWRTNDRWIFNLGTQYDKGPNATYYGIKIAFRTMLRLCDKRGVSSVGIPFIGAGIGGLDWDKVKEQIISAQTMTKTTDTVLIKAYHLS